MRKVYAIYLRCLLLGVEQSQRISLEVQSTLSICAEKSHFEPLVPMYVHIQEIKVLLHEIKMSCLKLWKSEELIC